MYNAANKDRSKTEAEYQPGHRERAPTDERAALKEQAKALLMGEKQWKSTPRVDVWEDVGEPEEVETDIDLDTPAEPEAQLPKPER